MGAGKVGLGAARVVLALRLSDRQGGEASLNLHSNEKRKKKSRSSSSYFKTTYVTIF